MFAGSFDLDAAEQVCDADLDTLQSLIDKSLLRQWGSGRLGMLETIHEYARELLERCGAAQELRARHARYASDLARSLAPAVRRYEDDALQKLAVERANILEALEWSVEGNVQIACHLVGDLCTYWITAGLARQVARFADQVLARQDATDSGERFLALAAASELRRGTGDHQRAVSLKSEALSALDECGQEVRMFGRDVPDVVARVALLKDRAQVAAELGDFAAAHGDAEQALALAESHGERSLLARARYAKGFLLFLAGEFDGARADFLESLELYESEHDRTGAELMVAECARRTGELDATVGVFGTVVRAAHAAADVWLLHEALQELGVAELHRGHAERGAVLLGASERLRAEIGAPVWDADDLGQAIDRARSEVGVKPFEDAREAGRGLSTDEAVSLALSIDS